MFSEYEETDGTGVLSIFFVFWAKPRGCDSLGGMLGHGGKVERGALSVQCWIINDFNRVKVAHDIVHCNAVTVARLFDLTSLDFEPSGFSGQVV